MAKAQKKAAPVKAKAKALVKKVAEKAEKVLARAEKAVANKRAPAKAKPVPVKEKAAPPKAPTKPLTKAAPKAKAAPAKPEKAKGAPATGRLSAGDVAPRFSLPDQGGKVISSDSLEGKSYVLYFYPKDDTPGCTREACGFRDDLGKFKARGVEVIGVSPDSSASHTKFVDKYGLNFTLLSDAEKSLANAYGVWTKKQNYGREYMGIERSTFLVGQDGKIKKAWRSVKVDGHIPAVYEAI